MMTTMDKEEKKMDKEEKAAVSRIPRYAQRIVELQKSGALVHSAAGVQHVTIRHDDGCAIWRGGECACDYEIQVGNKIVRQG